MRRKAVSKLTRRAGEEECKRSDGWAFKLGSSQPGPSFFVFSTSSQGPTQWAPTQKRTQGECLQYLFPSPYEAVVRPSATVAKNINVFPLEWAPLSQKCLILMVASVVKNPSMIRTGPQWKGSATQSGPFPKKWETPRFGTPPPFSQFDKLLTRCNRPDLVQEPKILEP